MKQRYNELTHDLCVRAVLEAFDDKWLRRDVVQLANKYSGVGFAQLKQGKQNADMRPILEAAEGIALELEERILELLGGEKLTLEYGERYREPGCRVMLRGARFWTNGVEVGGDIQVSGESRLAERTYVACPV